MRHDSLLYVYSNFINKSPLYTLCTYGMAEYYKNDLSKMIALFPIVHSYIYIYISHVTVAYSHWLPS